MTSDRPANVHYVKTVNGVKLYGIGHWEENANQYHCPLTAGEMKLTGCHTEFARQPLGLMPYKKAAYEARKRYGYVRKFE
jgi:hypothetical protein